MLSLRIVNPRSKSTTNITSTAPTRQRRSLKLFVAQPSSHSHSSSSWGPSTTDDNDDENKSGHNNMNMSELRDAVQLPAVDASLQTEQEQELDNITTTNMTPTISSSSSSSSSVRPGAVGMVIILLTRSLIQAGAMVNKAGRQHLPEWLRWPGDVIFWSFFVMVAFVLPFR